MLFTRILCASILLAVAAQAHAQLVQDESAVAETDADAVLNNWVVASQERGPFQAELKCFQYDDAFQTLKISRQQLWARSPTEWRRVITPDSSAVKGDPVTSNGREYKISASSPATSIRFGKEFWWIDHERRNFQRVELPQPAGDISSNATASVPSPDFWSLWLRKSSADWFPDERLLVFPQLNEREFLRMKPREGNSSNPELQHVVFDNPNSYCRRMELLINKSDSLLFAARLSVDTNATTVYVVINQSHLAPQEPDPIQPPDIEVLESEGYWDLNREPGKLLGRDQWHLAEAP